MSVKKDCVCSYWSQGQQECLYSGGGYCAHNEKKPTVSEGFVEMLRDRLMAIPIREYFISSRRKVIADRITEEFIKEGVEVVKK